MLVHIPTDLSTLLSAMKLWPVGAKSWMLTEKLLVEAVGLPMTMSAKANRAASNNTIERNEMRFINRAPSAADLIRHGELNANGASAPRP